MLGSTLPVCSQVADALKAIEEHTVFCACADGYDPAAPWWSSARFVTRGHCGAWLPGFEELYRFSGLSTFLVYFLIGAFLLWTHVDVCRTKGLNPLSGLASPLGVFGAFVLFCGAGHFLDEFLSFVLPSYHVVAIWHGVTTVISWSAVPVIFKRRLELVHLLGPSR